MIDMKEKLRHHINSLIKRYPILKECENSIIRTYDILEECFLAGHKLLIAGNGGSNADAEHIVGELMKGFKNLRKCQDSFADKLKAIDPIRGVELAEKLQGGLPAIALAGNQSLGTAFTNDVSEGGLFVFAQEVYGYGKEGDVLLGISTSGNSINILNSVVVAKALGLKVVGLTGKAGGELAKICDVSIKVPVNETYMVQELHLPVYHCLCLMLEENFFGLTNTNASN